jgi:hypothetical protein
MFLKRETDERVKAVNDAAGRLAFDIVLVGSGIFILGLALIRPEISVPQMIVGQWIILCAGAFAKTFYNWRNNVVSKRLFAVKLAVASLALITLAVVWVVELLT